MPDRLSVGEALLTRRSVRAFLPTPIPRETIVEILRQASRAPSGTNTQPWNAYVLTGATLQRIARLGCEAYDDPRRAELYQDEYHYYPERWVSPYIDRRRKVGWDLYGLLGIGKADKERMHAQHARNYRFFDAPVAMMFSIDRILEIGSWLDFGMFLQSVMVAARGFGLDTCPQAAWTPFHTLIARELEFPANQMLVCGMALGYADNDAIENTLVTEREPVEGFTRFMD